MKLVTTIIEEIKQDFEGGNSLACDWNIIIKRAVQTTLENINPSTLKRNVPIYGGFLRNSYVYYCPDNVRVPVTLETNDKSREFGFAPAKVFYKDRNANTFTIETINGYKFLVAFHQVANASQIIDEMDSLTDITGSSTPVLDEQNYLSGGASVQGVFTSVGDTIGRTLNTILNLTSYDRGTIIVPSYFRNAGNIASVSFKLMTDDTNYFTVSSSVDSIGSTFVDGWNRVRFLVKNLQPTLIPLLDTITKWEMTITTKTGTTEIVNVDNIMIHQSAQYYLEFYSDQPFVNGVTNAWQKTVDYNNNDLLNLSDDEASIVHYEACLLLATNGSQKQDFAGQLQRKYKQYFAENPSDAEPLSYNIGEEIDMSIDGSVANIPSKITFQDMTSGVRTVTAPPNNQSGNSSFTVLTPQGVIDDTNVTFVFTRTPTLIVINGSTYSTTSTINNVPVWTIVGNTVTLQFAVGVGGTIYGII